MTQYLHGYEIYVLIYMYLRKSTFTNNIFIMENTYKIIEGAATEYLKEDFSNSHTAKFLAKSEGRKVFLHEIDDDEDLIHVSQYEKTEKHRIPILLLEACDEIEEEKNVTSERSKKVFEVNIPEKVKKISGGVLMLVILNIFIYA